MKRKDVFLISAGVCAAFSCSSQNTKQKSTNEKNRKPNIIFIMADDLGYGDLGCYGQKLIKTPVMDSLAAHGLRFTQCYSGSSVCAPSRGVLMTGLHTGHSTIRGNFGKGGVVGLGGAEGRIPLSVNDTTIATVLKKAGYTTAIIGKWGIGEPNTEGIPNKQGFDEFFGFLNQRRAHSYYPDYLWSDTTKVMLSGNANGQKKEYSHELYVEHILKFLDENKDKPFFLYVPFCLPHADYEGPDNGIYEDKDWKDNEKCYAAMVSRMDNSVGRIMAKLKELNLDNDTYVFITSDNGASGETEDPTIFDSNKPFRGHKRDGYEGAIRVPMIVYAPGKIVSGKTSNQIWYFPDVLPTVADIAHVKAPQHIDGVSILPTLEGKTQDLSKRYLYWEFYEKDGWRAVRFGDWKAIQQNMYNTPEAIELYNLKDDIGETKNVAKEHPEIIEKVKKMFNDAHTPSPYFQWRKDFKSKDTM